MAHTDVDSIAPTKVEPSWWDSITGSITDSVKRVTGDNPNYAGIDKGPKGGSILDTLFGSVKKGAEVAGDNFVADTLDKLLGTKLGQDVVGGVEKRKFDAYLRSPMVWAGAAIIIFIIYKVARR